MSTIAVKPLRLRPRLSVAFNLRAAAWPAGVLALTAYSALERGGKALAAPLWIDEGLSIGIAQHPVTSLPGLGEVRARLAEASPAWLAAALALELGSCLAFVVCYRGVLAPRLGRRRSYDLGMAVQGANVLLPAGGASGLALGAWALRQGGMATAYIGRRFRRVRRASVSWISPRLSAGVSARMGKMSGVST